MSTSLRIFAGFFLLLAIVAYALLNAVFDELMPAFSRATEETLVDTANVLAEVIVDDMRQAGTPMSGFSSAMNRYLGRRLDAQIYESRKTDPELRVYVTDTSGTVVFDSTGRDLGANYSHWNDVYLTLRGEYGARSTRDDEQDEFSSVYFVAAPIRDGDELIGVVSVGKPARALLPYLQESERRIRLAVIALVAGGVVLSALLAYWMSRSVRKLTSYAQAVSRGDPARPPDLREPELAELSAAMAKMREELEGREYVENTINALTHELKSPLAAIRAAVELLRENPEGSVRNNFLDNVDSESRRLQAIAERLLQLASIEKRDAPAEIRSFDLVSVVKRALAARRLRAGESNLTFETELPDSLMVDGDEFLLEQAVANLLDNAIDFAAGGKLIRTTLAKEGGKAVLRVRDFGAGIPGFALGKIYERFYSLPRPGSGKKSTGLGLSFVREIMRLHGGEAKVVNAESGGVMASMVLPAK